jgi:hypothetical protein
MVSEMNENRRVSTSKGNKKSNLSVCQMENCTPTANLFWVPLTKILIPWLAVVALLTLISIIAYRLVIKKRTRDAYGLITSFVAIGALLGITAGASKSPVIGTFLPALITLITAVVGYLFTRDSLEKWRPVIPFCLIGMMMASVVNMFAGTSLTEMHRSYERAYEVWLLEQKMLIDLQKEFMLLKAKEGKFASFPPPGSATPCE